MSHFVTYLTLIVLSCLSPGPGSIIVISGQGEKTSTKVLEVCDGQSCASEKEKENARNEIHQITNSAISAIVALHIHTCNGTPGWRCVAFINMTDTSYNCPTGLNLTSHSKRTCGRSHTTWEGCSSTLQLEIYHTAVCVGG